MRSKPPASFPAPDFRDKLERRGWREYPADIRVRVRRFFRGEADIIAVEYNGDILHLYKPVTNQREAHDYAKRLVESNGKKPKRRR